MDKNPGRLSRPHDEKRMVDAGVSKAPPGARESALPADLLKRAAVRLEFDGEAGWPPKLAGGERAQCLIPSQPASVFTLELQRQFLSAARKDPQVSERLTGRWETLGVHSVASRDRPSQVEHRAQVHFYNYTTNQLIVVTVDDGVVSDVRTGQSHQHPEAPVEVAQAIGVARSDPRLKTLVDGLLAHAILYVPSDPASPGYGHRCLHVMFTEPSEIHREVPVLYAAIVDLCDQRVVAAGNCPCVADAARNLQPHRY
jgi:hypothetical protein